MQVFSLRAIVIAVALAQLAWGVLFYFDPAVALGSLGRSVADPVIARQYPLYLASCSLAYALVVLEPSRYTRVVWICIIQRAIELVVAVLDWRVAAISPAAFVTIAAIECSVMIVAFLAVRNPTRAEEPPVKYAYDRGLKIALRCFGGLEVFWFFTSTIFVQLGARLLHWKLQDPYTTQQQGIALLIIGLVSLLVASDVVRYRVFVWVPICSQLIGVVNAFNEIRLGSITWTIAAVQWTIQLSIVFALVWFSRTLLFARFSRSATVRL